MAERIKLIWDFRGPNAEPTAAHHVIHLKEFAEKENLHHPIIEKQAISDMHSIAYLVVDKSMMLIVRDLLKPHRAQIYSE